MNLFELFLGGKANGTAPCQELPTISPLCGEVQAHFPLCLWLLSNRVAQLTLSFVFCLSARRFLNSFPLPTEHRADFIKIINSGGISSSHTFCPSCIFWFELKLRMTVWGYRYQTGEIEQHKSKEFAGKCKPHSGKKKKKIEIPEKKWFHQSCFPADSSTAALFSEIATSRCWQRTKAIVSCPHQQSILAPGTLSWPGSSEFQPWQGCYLPVLTCQATAWL